MASTSKVTRLNIKMYFDILVAGCHAFMAWPRGACGNCEMGIFKFIPTAAHRHSHTLALTHRAASLFYRAQQ